MKNIKAIIITVVAAFMVLAYLALAGFLKNDQTLELDVVDPQYKVNGTEKTFDENEESMPVIDDTTGKLLLPLRHIVETMGGSVNWIAETRKTQIKFKNTQIELSANSDTAAIDGYSIILEDQPQIINSNLYVSADFISDNLGTEVEWNDDEDKIIIRTEAFARPVINNNVITFDKLNVEYYVEVPVITGLNDKNYEKELNTALSTRCLGEIQNFMQQSAAGLKSQQYQLTIRNYVFYRTANLISIVADRQRTGEDGKIKSHKDSIVIDLNSQSILNLGDLFKNEKYTKTLQDSIRHSLQEAPQEHLLQEPFEISGQEPFFIMDDAIVILYKTDSGEYDRFTIPFHDIKNHLKKEYEYLIQP